MKGVFTLIHLNRARRNHRILLIALLGLLLLALTGCREKSVFDGSMAVNDDGFTMEYTVLNKEQTARISLAAGDQLQVTFAHAKGSVDVTVGMDGKEPLYKGSAQENAEFSLLVSETGLYRITVTGHQAKGRVAFIRVPQAAE